MVARKRKKNTRLRGSKTHGYGSMKKHRGSGHRGGRGNAGSGKRADSKKPSFWGENRISGKAADQKGFFSWRGSDNTTINVSHLSSIAGVLVKSGHAKMDGGVVTMDLGTMGYTKLLGAGTVAHKLALTVMEATPGAVAKIEKAGGSVSATRVVDKDAVLNARVEKVKAERALRAPKKVEIAPPAEKGEKKEKAPKKEKDEPRPDKAPRDKKK